MSRAFSPASPPTAAMVTRPVSSTLILAPVASWMPRMVLPLGPMRSPILSGLICIVKMRGAHGDISARWVASALVISFEDVQPALAGLLQRLFHDLEVEALDLDVHLDRGDAGRRCRPP